MSTSLFSFESHQEHGTLSLMAASFVGQTLFFGAYVATFPLGIHLLLRKKLRGAMNKILFVFMIFGFLLCTAFWTVSAANLFICLNSLVGEHDGQSIVQRGGIAQYMELFNAIILLIFTVADAVVLSRAWSICQDFTGMRLILRATLAMWILTAVSALVTISLEAVVVHEKIYEIPIPRALSVGVSTSQVIAVALTLLTNAFATGCIAWRACHFRRSAKELKGMMLIERQGPTVMSILTLLVESGALYCASTIFLVLSTVVRLPGSGIALDSVYSPIHVQLAGIYPSLILVLVNHQRTTEPLAPRPAPTLQTDPVIRFAASSSSTEKSWEV